LKPNVCVAKCAKHFDSYYYAQWFKFELRAYLGQTQMEPTPGR